MFTLHPRFLHYSKILSRSFNTIAEATHFFQKIHPEHSLSKPPHVSTSDPVHYSQSIVQIIPYLSSTKELDLKLLLEQLSEKEVEQVTSVSAMQRNVEDMVVARNAISDFPGMSKSVHLSYCILKDLIYYLKRQENLNDQYAPKPRYSTWVKNNPIKPNLNDKKRIRNSLEYIKSLLYPDMTNLDKLVLVNYWLSREQWELARSYLEETYLTEEESLLLARMIVTHQEWRALPMLLQCMKGDYVELAAQHVFFVPSRKVSQALLNGEDNNEIIENIAAFLEKVKTLGLEPEKILQLVKLLEMPAVIKMQLALQFFHSSSEHLSLIVGSILEPDDFMDLAPILSHTKHTKKLQLCIAYIDCLLKEDLHPVATSLSEHLIKTSFIPNNLTSTQWVIHLMSELTLRPKDIAALVKAVPLKLHTDLLQHACETQHAKLIAEIVRYSHELDQTALLLSEFSDKVSPTSKDDYIEDCLLYYLPELPGSSILSLSRKLTDQGVITPKMEKFWMIVGYDKKGNDEFATEVLTHSSKMFGVAEFSNLTSLCSRGLAECAKNLLGTFQTEQRYFENLQDDIDKLVDTKIPLVHLTENNFLYNVSKRYSVHVAVHILLNSGMREPYLEMFILLKQLERHQNLTQFLTQYGFLIPISFVERMQGSASANSKLEQKIVASSYFYSYCKNFMLDELALKMLQVSSFTKKEVTDKIFVFYLLYSNDEYVRGLIEKRKHTRVDRMFYKVLKEKRKVMSSELDEVDNSDENVAEDFDEIVDTDFEDNYVEDFNDDQIEEARDMEEVKNRNL